MADHRDFNRRLLLGDEQKADWPSQLLLHSWPVALLVLSPEPLYRHSNG